MAVLGSEPEIYFLARRHSATGYIYTYGLMEAQPFARRMQDEMIREIGDQRAGIHRVCRKSIVVVAQACFGPGNFQLVGCLPNQLHARRPGRCPFAHANVYALGADGMSVTAKFAESAWKYINAKFGRRQ